MGIFDRFSRGNKKQDPVIPKSPAEKVSVNLSDMNKWLDKELSTQIKKAEEKTSELCDVVCSRTDNVKRAISDLGHQSFDPSDKTYAMVNMAKDTFVNKSTASLSTVKKPRNIGDYSEIESFRNHTSGILEEIKKATPKQAFFISKYFKKQATAMIESIRDADTAVSEMNKFLKEDGIILKKTAEAAKSVDSLSNIISGILTKEAELEEETEAAEKADKKIAEKVSELDRFTNSEKWNEHVLAKKTLDETDGIMKAAEADANSILSVLRRPMKKLSHEKEMTDLPENPFKEIVVSGGDMGEIIKTVTDAMNSGDITLKQSEREKITSLSKSMDEINRLKETFNNARLLHEKTERSFDRDLEEKRSAMESEISRIRSEKERADRDIESIRNDIGRLRDEKNKRHEEAGRAVQEATGKEVNIIV